MWTKQSTAATIIVGPILDSAGAEYASAVIGDLSISKNGGTLTAMASAATLTHIANGQYTLVTTTGNLDTLGRAQITCNKSTYQMPPVNLMVVPAMVFDSLVLATDDLDTNSKKWNDLPTVALPLVPTTAGRTLDVSAGGEAGVDWANVGSPTTTVALSGTTVKTATDVETDTANIQARIPAALTSNGNMKSSLLEIITTALTEGATGRIAAAWQAAWNVASSVWTSASVNQTGDSYARIGATGSGLTSLAQSSVWTSTLAAALSPIRSNTAQTGSSTTITLDASASAVTDFYVQCGIYLTGGTGAGQYRTIDAYNGTTKVADVSESWYVTPDNTTTFAIRPEGVAHADIRQLGGNELSAGYLKNIADYYGLNTKIQGHVESIATDAITAASLATDAVTEIQNGLATSAELLLVKDRVSYCLTVLVGACADAGTAAETYVHAIGGETFTVDFTGLDDTGTRTTTTLSKV